VKLGRALCNPAQVGGTGVPVETEPELSELEGGVGGEAAVGQSLHQREVGLGRDLGVFKPGDVLAEMVERGEESILAELVDGRQRVRQSRTGHEPASGLTGRLGFRQASGGLGT